MQKTKTKNDGTPSTDHQRGFVWVWVISHIAFWVVMWLPLDLRLSLIRFSNYRPNDTASPVMILFTTLAMALLQWRVAQRVLNQSMRGWVLASMLGALLSIGAFTTIQSSNLYVWILSLLLPIAFVQTLWLHRYVKSAWLWFIASFVGALFFAFPLSNYDYRTGLIPWMLGLGVSQGIIQAVVMRHLWLRSRETEKAKQQPLAAEESEDQEVIQRLSVNDIDEDIMDEESPVSSTHARRTI